MLSYIRTVITNPGRVSKYDMRQGSYQNKVVGEQPYNWDGINSSFGHASDKVMAQNANNVQLINITL